MANKSGTIYGSPAGNGNYLYIEWYEDANTISTSNNTSKVYATVKLYNAYGSHSDGDPCPWYVIIDGTKYSGTIYKWSGSPVTVGSASKDVTHNADGSKSITISAYFDTNGTSTGAVSASGSATLTSIPRYATISQSLSAKTETSINMNWSSDSTIDYVWYSNDNGSNWTAIGSVNAKSGSYALSGFSPDTTYNIKTRVRRKDSQLTTDSSALAVTTYAYPYAESMPDFTIGNSVTIGIYNPLGRSVSVELQDSAGNNMGTNTTSGTSYKGWSSSSTVNNLYASIPNAKSGTYKIKVTYNSHNTTKIGGTYSVNVTASTPTIGSVAYEDTNSSVTAITQNNQKIVRNKSTVRYTASNAQAKNSATISSCKVEVNGITYTLSKSGSAYIGGNAVINSGTNVTAKFTVTDSRGLSFSKSISVQMLDWSIPTAIISVERRNNYYSETDLTVDANYSYIDGHNSVTIAYKAKKQGASSWELSGTLQDNVSSLVTMDNNYEWVIQIVITDLLGGTVTYNTRLARGMPIIYFDRLKESVGIDCFPQKEKSLEINGLIDAEGQILTSFKNSVAGGRYGSSQSTVENLVNEVRLSSGCSGSTSITTAYTKNNITVKTGWYNFLWIPHRSGGKNGVAQGDNCNYGQLLLFGMNNTNGRFIVRVSSSSIAELAKIYTSVEIADYIVEQGTNGIWTYRKWNSGLAEIWGETTFSNTAVNTASGSDYVADLGVIAFPFEFKARPKGNAYAMSTSARVWLMESTNRSKTQTGTLKAVASTIYSSIASITVYLDFVGNWK